MLWRAHVGAMMAGACLIATPVSAETLKEALIRAYLDNPTLAAARARQRGTDETVVIERADALPSVSCLLYTSPSPRD